MSYDPRSQGYGENYYNFPSVMSPSSGRFFNQNGHHYHSHQQHTPLNAESSYPYTYYQYPGGVSRGRVIGESSPSEPNVYVDNAASYPSSYPYRYAKRRRVNDGESSSAPASDYVYNGHYKNVLLELCRSNHWSAALQRWRNFSYEASPIPRMNHHPGATTPLSTMKEPNGACDEKESSLPDLPLYQPTILGMVCSSRGSFTETEGQEPAASSRLLLIQEILNHSPAQVGCNQAHVGHTPLRDAVLNPHCSVEVLKMLLRADQENCHRRQHSSSEDYHLAASHQKDSQGLSPLDHLIIKLRQPDTSPRTGSSSIELLETFLEMRPPAPKGASTTKVSPLLRLLTVVEPLPLLYSMNEETPPRFSKIQEMIKCLLRQEPELLYDCSRATGCSPLHIAARTCNFLPIIRELVSADTKKNQLIGLANNFGDLPIHIVCSNGADLEVLQFLASKTVDHDRRLLWTPTGFGYTPADLLWLNHIEAGSSFVKVRTFHAMYAATATRFEKDNEYYQKVLRESVNDLVNGESSNGGTTTLERMECAKNKFGGMLDRLFALLSAFSSHQTEPLHDGKYLHIACMVCAPYGHTLALPLFKLLLWIFRDDLLTADESGSIPLHHALGNNLFPLEPPSNQIIGSPKKKQGAIETHWTEWAEYCQDLIRASPECCGVANRNGQLPLHLLLSHRPPGSNKVAQQLHQELIDKVVEAFPESVHTRDPVSSLDPFMLASMADDPLDTIYKLLRQCPNLCRVNGGAEL